MMQPPPANNRATPPFIATVSADAKDTGGRALAAPYSWSFVTGTTTAQGPAPVGLGTAGNFVVLAKTAISTVPASTLTGDNLTTAVSNMENAYTDAAGRPTPDFLELGAGNIGGLTLPPGLYKWTSTVTIPNSVTIAGGANDTWIFQTTGDLTMASAKSITLSGGAQAKNIVWQVAGQVSVGANAHFEGVILSKTAITLQTGSTMNGRALAQTQVALQQATVTQPAP